MVRECPYPALDAHRIESCISQGAEDRRLVDAQRRTERRCANEEDGGAVGSHGDEQHMRSKVGGQGRLTSLGDAGAPACLVDDGRVAGDLLRGLGVAALLALDGAGVQLA